MVRPAGAADGPAIGHIRVETWKAAYAGMLPADALAALDADVDGARWTRGLATATGRGWVRMAFLPPLAEPVGFVAAGEERQAPDVSAPSGGCGEIYAIYVLPSAQGAGAGRALLEAALGGLRVRGFRRAVLWVLEANAPARRFYEAAGFAPDGPRHSFEFGGAAAPEIRMAIDL